jgi:hypothetical protein
MKKFAFLAVFGFLAVSLFAQNTINYDKILQGDLSDFVGYWVNGDNERLYLRSDGKNTADKNYQTASFSKKEGIYSWVMFGNREQIVLNLVPIGVDIEGINTDKTRLRIYTGYTKEMGPSDPKHIYYKESEFPATHVTSENLRLRSRNDLNSETIETMEKGTMVLILSWGNNVSIDGNSARWALVDTIDGLRGWCYSGYLKEIEE